MKLKRLSNKALTIALAPLSSVILLAQHGAIAADTITDPNDDDTQDKKKVVTEITMQGNGDHNEVNDSENQINTPSNIIDNKKTIESTTDNSINDSVTINNTGVNLEKPTNNRLNEHSIEKGTKNVYSVSKNHHDMENPLQISIAGKGGSISTTNNLKGNALIISNDIESIKQNNTGNKIFVLPEERNQEYRKVYINIIKRYLDAQREAYNATESVQNEKTEIKKQEIENIINDTQNIGLGTTQLGVPFEDLILEPTTENGQEILKKAGMDIGKMTQLSNSRDGLFLNSILHIKDTLSMDNCKDKNEEYVKTMTNLKSLYKLLKDHESNRLIRLIDSLIRYDLSYKDSEKNIINVIDSNVEFEDGKNSSLRVQLNSLLLGVTDELIKIYESEDNALQQAIIDVIHENYDSYTADGVRGSNSYTYTELISDMLKTIDAWNNTYQKEISDIPTKTTEQIAFKSLIESCNFLSDPNYDDNQSIYKRHLNLTDISLRIFEQTTNAEILINPQSIMTKLSNTELITYLNNVLTVDNVSTPLIGKSEDIIKKFIDDIIKRKEQGDNFWLANLSYPDILDPKTGYKIRNELETWIEKKTIKELTSETKENTLDQLITWVSSIIMQSEPGVQEDQVIELLTSEINSESNEGYINKVLMPMTYEDLTTAQRFEEKIKESLQANAEGIKTKLENLSGTRYTDLTKDQQLSDEDLIRWTIIKKLKGSEYDIATSRISDNDLATKTRITTDDILRKAGITLTPPEKFQEEIIKIYLKTQGCATPGAVEDKLKTREAQDKIMREFIDKQKKSAYEITQNQEKNETTIKMPEMQPTNILTIDVNGQKTSYIRLEDQAITNFLNENPKSTISHRIKGIIIQNEGMISTQQKDLIRMTHDHTKKTTLTDLYTILTNLGYGAQKQDTKSKEQERAQNFSSKPESTCSKIIQGTRPETGNFKLSILRNKNKSQMINPHNTSGLPGDKPSSSPQIQKQSIKASNTQEPASKGAKAIEDEIKLLCRTAKIDTMTPSDRSQNSDELKEEIIRRITFNKTHYPNLHKNLQHLKKLNLEDIINLTSCTDLQTLPTTK